MWYFLPVWFAAGLHVQYPITFKIENQQEQRHSHCGVLEFTAEEGLLYMPYWVSSGAVVGGMLQPR